MNFISKRLPTLMKKFILPGLGVLALVVFSSVIIFEATKATVVFAYNGEEQTVDTHAKTVGELLEELDIEVGKHDSLSMGLEEEIENGITIALDEAKRVFITVDEKTDEYHTTLETLADLLEDEKLVVTAEDELSHTLDQHIFDDLHVSITKAFEVIINDAGKETKVWSLGNTVEELLAEHKIDLPSELDVIEPALNEKTTKGQEVSITRVEKVVEKVEETVNYKTESKNDNTLAKGKQKTITNGKNGKLVKKYEIVYENGKKVDRKLIDETVTEQPVNKVVAVGTKVEQPKLVTVAKSSKSKGEPSGKAIYMTASAYTASCNGCSGITRTGINLKANPNAKVIAVDPSIIPLGTKVWVEGYGYAVAGDTGGAIKGNRIDVHVPTKSEAYRFGVRKVKVIVLD